MEHYHKKETFDRWDVTQNPFPKGEYENCTFTNCLLSSADLSGSTFIDCVFQACDLSLAKLSKTTLRSVLFTGCKMLGLQLAACNEFALSFTFRDCILDHSSFYRLKIKKTQFSGCRLSEADFAECDLSQSLFDNCDLTQATFDNTNLEKADLRTARNYSIDPDNNRIKKAQFSLSGVPGLLYKFDIIIEH